MTSESVIGVWLMSFAVSFSPLSKLWIVQPVIYNEGIIESAPEMANEIFFRRCGDDTNQTQIRTP